MLCSAVIKSARAPLWCEEQNSLVGHSVRAQTASVGLGCVEKHGTRRAHARRAHAHEKGQALSCRGGSVASVPSWQNRKAPAPRQANGDWNVHESMHARTCATHGAVRRALTMGCSPFRDDVPQRAVAPTGVCACSTKRQRFCVQLGKAHDLWLFDRISHLQKVELAPLLHLCPAALFSGLRVSASVRTRMRPAPL